MVPEMKNYDYANRLKKLALPSLKLHIVEREGT